MELNRKYVKLTNEIRRICRFSNHTANVPHPGDGSNQNTESVIQRGAW